MTAKPKTTRPLLDSPRLVRRMAGWSQARVAVLAGVGIARIRIYEIRQDEIADVLALRRIERIYETMRHLIVHAA